MCVLYILFIFISVQSSVVWATPFVLIMFFSNRINNKNKKIIWAMLSNDAYAEMHMHIWAKWWIGSGWKMQYSYNGLMCVCVCVYEHVYYSTRSIVLHIVVMQTGIGEYSEKYQFERCHFVFRSARSNCIMWIQSPCTNCYIEKHCIASLGRTVSASRSAHLPKMKITIDRKQRRIIDLIEWM